MQSAITMHTCVCHLTLELWSKLHSQLAKTARRVERCVCVWVCVCVYRWSCGVGVGCKASMYFKICLFPFALLPTCQTIHHYMPAVLFLSYYTLSSLSLSLSLSLSPSSSLESLKNRIPLLAFLSFHFPSILSAGILYAFNLSYFGRKKKWFHRVFIL